MTMGTVVSKDIGKLKALWKRFADPDYRTSFLHSRLRTSVAAQVYFIRESRQWTQAELAARAATKQPAISRIEKGEAGLNVSTLEAIAGAFGVGLSIKFVPYSEVAEEAAFGRPEAYVASFDDDVPASLALEEAPAARFERSYKANFTRSPAPGSRPVPVEPRFVVNAPRV